MLIRYFMLLIAAFPAVGHSYIGPGLGSGAIAAALGVVAAILIGLFAIVYYPIKRALKRRSSKVPASPTTSTNKNDRLK